MSVDQVVMSSGTNIEVNKASKSDSIEISGYKQTQLFVNANLVIGGNAGTCGTSTCDLDEVSESSILRSYVIVIGLTFPPKTLLTFVVYQFDISSSN